MTDKEIRELCLDKKNRKDRGGLIEPFSEDALQSESYDLAIGTEIEVLKKDVRCLSLLEQESIDSMYEEIDLAVSGYIISPKEYILVSLKEKVSLPDNITAHIRPRTRFTRLGLIVSDQHCNSTYSGKLRIGIFNATDYPIKIFPGIRIAQMVFEELKSKPSEEKMYKNKKNAVYQGEEKFVGAKFSDELEKKVSETVDLLLKKDD
nr:dCTP deaminase [Blautia obeum]